MDRKAIAKRSRKYRSCCLQQFWYWRVVRSVFSNSYFRRVL